MSLLARQSRGNPTSPITTGLVVLAFMVVSAKYIAPILYYISERLAQRPIADVPVMWDFWWPLYLLAAAAVSARTPKSLPLLIGVTVARSLWSVVVLTLFFSQPVWTFWQLQWLFYEVVTLGCMATGLILALSPGVRDQLAVRYRPVSVIA